MKKSLLFLVIIILIVGCRKEFSLYISGDSQSIDAEIYVDGEKVGTTQRHSYLGSTSKAPVVMKREKKLQQRLGIKHGDMFSGTEIKVPLGMHNIEIVNKEGKRLKKNILIEGENYLAVDFTEMVIRGGD